MSVHSSWCTCDECRGKAARLAEAGTPNPIIAYTLADGKLGIRVRCFSDISELLEYHLETGALIINIKHLDAFITYLQALRAHKATP